MKANRSLNHIYRLVWSQLTGSWVAVAENRRGRGKGRTSRKLALLAAAFASAAGAAPQGGQVASGSATISQSGNTTTIQQSSNRVGLNWSSFNIGAQETVNFVQPSASALAVNRIFDTNGSQILGRLNANGQVWLINPNGVMFGQGAQVNVGGLVASTLELNQSSLDGNVRSFSAAGPGAITNLGNITAADGGYVAFLGNTVSNQGTIAARQGSVMLGAGDSARLTFSGNALVGMEVQQGTLATLAENGGLLKADGGMVVMNAAARDALLASVVNNTGVIEARSAEDLLGSVRLAGDLVVNTGSISASGSTGGSVSINGRSLLQAGTVSADGDSGAGGSVSLQASGALLHTDAALTSANGATTGGQVRLQAGSAALLSGTMQANGAQGGEVVVTAPQLTLSAASLSANGDSTGGSVLVGGDAHGANPAVPNATQVVVNPYTRLNAGGPGGKVVVWSDDTTSYYGQAATGPRGFIEVSGKQTLNYGGQANAGADGNVLLDPTNLVIDSSAPSQFYIDLANPSPSANGLHGQAGTSSGVRALSGGNIVVASSNDNFGGAAAGAVYLYNGNTGALISTLTGGQAGDRVGSNVDVLGNGNFVTSTTSWHSGALANAGAVTWGSGSTGVSGVVSSSNSLVGSNANDNVGSLGITALSNGNYVVNSYAWNGNLGAVTWGNGATGTSGVVSSANSLTGSLSGDYVGNGRITALSNGNYLVSSVLWNGNRGAVTWGSGTAGVSGAVSSSNSLVGSTAGDYVGSNGSTSRILLLSNGNYVVGSPRWNNGGLANAGAATWGSGTAGVTGVISSANSLVGTHANDYLGSDINFANGLYALTNGNYVVATPNWNGMLGAATWGSGTAGVTGAVSSTNSLVGSNTYDSIGGLAGGSGSTITASSVTALTNGNYVVTAPSWKNGSLPDAGAATWGNGSTGTTGVVSSANSLVGSSASDLVGIAVTALTNGNYVVGSNWSNGAVAAAGAATWGNGSTGITGTISSANSLVGSTANDYVGVSGITALANGNYVVASSNWDNGASANVGAATWGDGSTGVKGTISSANSLIGATANDQIGSNGVFALSNGNYVVLSSLFANGALSQAGAATWGSGTAGVKGTVSSANSLVGASSGDRVGLLPNGQKPVVELANGNYVIVTPAWHSGANGNAGAVTWGSGTAGISGAVSASNSLVGSSAGDYVGYSGATSNQLRITTLSNGNYVVLSPTWKNGAVAQAGAVTWGSGTTGVSGVVSSSNSLVGSTTSDLVGSDSNGASFVYALSNGNYVVASPWWNRGGIADAGAVTFANGSTGVAGSISSSNSLLGSTASDVLGLYGVTGLANGNYVVDTPAYDQPGKANAGAVWLVSAPSNLLASISNAAGSVSLNPTALAGIATTGTTTLQASNNITINSAVNVSGALNLVAGNALTLNAGITSTATGTALQLAGKTFVNNAGASALSTPNGRWLVWSENPANDVRGGLAYDFKQYNAAYGVDNVLGSGNGFLYTLAPSITASLTGTVSKTYDTGIGATLSAANFSTSGTVDGDTVSLGAPTSSAYDNKNVGSSKTVTASGLSISGASNGSATVYGYQLSSSSASGNVGTITKADLQATGLSASNKVYDTTTSASLSGTATVTALGSDDVTAGGTATGNFTDKNVGNGKTVTVSGVTISGADAGNYNLLQPTGLTANITKADLQVTGLTANNKVYDTTISATLTGTATVAALGSDDVTAGGTASGNFTDKNVGTGKTVTVSGVTISGADAGNYNLLQPTGLTANITKADLQVTGLTANNKVYDTTNGATLSGTATVAALGNDVVTTGGTATGNFTDKNVGTGKTVTVSGVTISGADAGNYNLLQPTGLTANITKADLQVTGLTANNKVYDTTNGATLSGTATVAALGNDVVTAGGTAIGNFTDKNVGNGKSVTVSGVTISGADAGNYNLLQPTGLTANITKADLQVIGLTANNKVYDTTNNATLSGTATVAALGNDVVTAGGTATGSFADKNVGTGKSVTVSGVTISGTDAGNYNLLQPTGLTANITKANLNVTGLSASDKTYDGNTSVALTGSAQIQALGNDIVNLGGTASGQFSDSAAGSGKSVNVSGLSLSGTDAGNYQLVSPHLTASILPAPELAPAVVLQNQQQQIPNTVSSLISATILAPSTTTGQATPGIASGLGSSANPPAEAGGPNGGLPQTSSLLTNTTIIGINGPRLHVVDDGVNVSINPNN